jgi:hypothetical protein
MLSHLPFVSYPFHPSHPCSYFRRLSTRQDLISQEFENYRIYSYLCTQNMQEYEGK